MSREKAPPRAGSRKKFRHPAPVRGRVSTLLVGITCAQPETVRPVLGSVAQATLYGAVKSAPARLRQLSDSADPATRTFEAHYVLEGKNADAPLGATVTIWLPVPSTAGSLVVPNAAITDRGNGPGVWIVGWSPVGRQSRQ
jgi:hypothetical protein